MNADKIGKRPRQEMISGGLVSMQSMRTLTEIDGDKIC